MKSDLKLVKLGILSFSLTSQSISRNRMNDVLVVIVVIPRWSFSLVRCFIYHEQRKSIIPVSRVSSTLSDICSGSPLFYFLVWLLVWNLRFK